MKPIYIYCYSIETISDERESIYIHGHWEDVIESLDRINLYIVI